jgi:phosphatidate cytidylyltransferase
MNSTLKTRGLTAIVFIAVMIAGIFVNSYTFILLMSAIIGGCIWEFQSITCEKNLLRIVISIAGAITFSLFLAASNLFLMPNHFMMDGLFILFLIGIAICTLELYTHSDKPYQNISFAFFSLVYYGLFISSIYFISFEETGVYNPWLVFSIIAMTWTNDTMAYMVGSQVGKNKMFPRISPNKTWEGTIGGVLFTVFVAFIFHYFFGLFSPLQWLIIAILIGIFGTVGDLVESMLKRSINVKDTSTLLPGHGGLLDRFDSFTFHLPLTVYFIELSSRF